MKANMKWQVELGDGFEEWLLTIDKKSAQLLLNALTLIRKNTVDPWEKKIDYVTITKLSNESPELIKMAIVIVEPNIAVLYGLCGNFIVVGAWGELKFISSSANIKKAHDEIKSFKEDGHG